jgi:hypothetical protein
MSSLNKLSSVTLIGDDLPYEAVASCRFKALNGALKQIVLEACGRSYLDPDYYKYRCYSLLKDS